MGIRIGSVGQQSKCDYHVFELQSCFSTVTDEYFLNQDSITIALIQDACHMSDAGLDIVETKWEYVLVVLDSTASSIITYLSYRATFPHALTNIS